MIAPLLPEPASCSRPPIWTMREVLNAIFYALQCGRVAAESSHPNAVFDTKGYLATYKDVAAADMDPLARYLQYVAVESRNTFANEYFG